MVIAMRGIVCFTESTSEHSEMNTNICTTHAGIVVAVVAVIVGVVVVVVVVVGEQDTQTHKRTHNDPKNVLDDWCCASANLQQRAHNRYIE